jgi:hypothetical protein
LRAELAQQEVSYLTYCEASVVAEHLGVPAGPVPDMVPVGMMQGQHLGRQPFFNNVAGEVRPRLPKCYNEHHMRVLDELTRLYKAKFRGDETPAKTVAVCSLPTLSLSLQYLKAPHA